MKLLFCFFAGGSLESGWQYLSWIHRDDWRAMVSWVLMVEAVAGPLNVTVTHPVMNLEFARMLGRVLRRPSFVPAPAFELRAVLGKMAKVIVTGQQVLPAKVHELGFDFTHPQLVGFILNHMVQIARFMLSHHKLQCSSISEYIQDNRQWYRSIWYLGQ